MQLTTTCGDWKATCSTGSVNDALGRLPALAPLRWNARETIVDRFSMVGCVEEWLATLQALIRAPTNPVN